MWALNEPPAMLKLVLILPKLRALKKREIVSPTTTKCPST
ncbi:hypothetical protein PC116_g21267 [Phytophthora cactorum]|uniref:Uncharacterized protein n=1 Tax=Phytophthora cactorum TaxID=29920 RepID=A0A8T0Y535_9STRA|nr:hypothetical protein PC113_g19638 [Phytophthora cactorum]KAG2881471.1 hypothetical protein PC114_g21539 [Phytophthora cactorum]KAG2891504.1 hypothetical protein PC115_g19186 [Phytophthora cactorum]KAG3000422.1 hypothetical protein PC120_g20710 [Phytophthora cactorum]KAG4230447.1 hypothetical protein PC116_g21267 [Phytophthora cactorum]